MLQYSIAGLILWGLDVLMLAFDALTRPTQIVSARILHSTLAAPTTTISQVSPVPSILSPSMLSPSTSAAAAAASKSSSSSNRRSQDGLELAAVRSNINHQQRVLKNKLSESDSKEEATSDELSDAEDAADAFAIATSTDSSALVLSNMSSSSSSSAALAVAAAALSSDSDSAVLPGFRGRVVQLRLRKTTQSSVIDCLLGGLSSLGQPVDATGTLTASSSSFSISSSPSPSHYLSRYVYVMMPSLSWLAHPFSIVPAPPEKSASSSREASSDFLVYIKVQSSPLSWTHRLATMVESGTFSGLISSSSSSSSSVMTALKAFVSAATQSSTAAPSPYLATCGPFGLPEAQVS